jgi:hypothetical protein
LETAAREAEALDAVIGCCHCLALEVRTLTEKETCAHEERREHDCFDQNVFHAVLRLVNGQLLNILVICQVLEHA